MNNYVQKNRKSWISVYVYMGDQFICLGGYVYDSCTNKYGVASASRIDKITGLFCKRDL